MLELSESRGWKKSAVRALRAGESVAVTVRGARARWLRDYLPRLQANTPEQGGLFAALRLFRWVSFHRVYFVAMSVGATAAATSPDPDTLVVRFIPGPIGSGEEQHEVAPK